MLVSRHPLWGALRSLEEAAEDLGDGEWEPVLPPIEDRFVDVAFIESFALADPAPAMASLRSRWRSARPPLGVPSGVITQDLQARIDWEREQAERAAERALAYARSAESRRLALMRAALFERHQERLTNLSIEATVRRDEAAAAAAAERQRVKDIIEAEMAAAQQEGRERLAELEARLRGEAAEQVELARRRALEISATRRETMLRAGEDLYDEMIARMERPWPTPDAGEVSAEAEAEAANARVDEIGVSSEAAEAARREKAQEQREELVAAAGRLRAQIKAGTETAAQVVAYRSGIRLQVLPGGQRMGSDVTRMIADELEDFWAVGGGQRS